MNRLFKLAVATAAIAISQCGHAATYSFTGFFGESLPPGQSDYTATFELTLPGPVTAQTTIPAADLTSCMTHAEACTAVTFYPDAAAAGLAPATDWQAIGLSTASVTTFYYFDPSSFTTDGVYGEVAGFNPATLTVSDVSAVPEPTAAAMFGIATLGLAAIGRRRRAMGK